VRKFWTSLLSFVVLIASSAVSAADLNNPCENWLLLHIADSPASKGFAAWADLELASEPNDKVALVVRLPLDKIQSGLGALQTLGGGANTQVSLPSEMMAIKNGAFYAVALGQWKAVRDMTNKLEQRFPQAEFADLGVLTKSRMFSMPFPHQVLVASGKVSAKDLEGELQPVQQPVLLWDEANSHTYLIFPKEVLSGVTDELLSPLKVNLLSEASAKPLLSTLRDLPNDSHTVVQWRDVLGMTLETYRQLQALSGRPLTKDLPMPAEVARLVQGCVNVVCAIQQPEESVLLPQVSEDEVELIRDRKVLSAMLNALEMASGQSYKKEDGLELAIEAIARTQGVSPDHRQRLSLQIEEINPTRAEGRYLDKYLGNGQGAYAVTFRFAQLWKVLQQALSNEDQPLSEASIADLSRRLMTATDLHPAAPPAKTSRANIPLPNASAQPVEVREIITQLGQLTDKRGFDKPGVFIAAVTSVLESIPDASERERALTQLKTIKLRDWDVSNSRTTLPAAGRLQEAWQIIVAHGLNKSSAAASEATPSARPDVSAFLQPEAIDRQTKLDIIDLLRSHLRFGGIASNGSIRRGFGDVIRAIALPDQKVQAYRETLKEIAFSKTEYQALNSESKVATLRLVRAWRALQLLLDDPSLQQPIYSESVAEFSARINARIGTTGTIRKRMAATKARSEPTESLRGISASASATLRDQDLRDSQITEALQQWHGIILRERPEGQVQPLVWTMLFYSSDATMRAGGYSVDYAFPVKIENGLVTEVLLAEREQLERTFYQLAAAQLNVEPVQVHLKLYSKEGKGIDSPIEIGANVVLKMRLKHKLNANEIGRWLNGYHIVHSNMNGNVELASNNRNDAKHYFLQLVNRNGPLLKLVTIYSKLD
jgi:hypothetical protein